MLLGRPVKWIEDRSENLMSTGFARDYAMRGRIAATRDGRILAIGVDVIADHGAFNATAQPTRYPAGFFSVFTGSYDVEAAHCRVTGVVHEQGARRGRVRVLVPDRRGGLPGRATASTAWRASWGSTRSSCGCANLLRPDQFPYESKTGWVYDSGDYERGAAARRSSSRATTSCAREQAEKRERGELMGIGVSFFTEAVGAGPRKHMDMLGLGMNDGAALRDLARPAPRSSAISVQTQGQGHETTFAQIVAAGARDPAGGRRGRARRHRHDAVRARHLRRRARRR